MPINFQFPVISKSGHHYRVVVEPMPFKGERWVDPCTDKCTADFQNEMKDFSEDIRKWYDERHRIRGSTP